MSINDKRAEAARKLTAVQRKAARLKREKGVELSGSKFDVRVERAKIKQMNSRQLDAFIRRAEQFTHRSTQFVAGANGTPLSSATVQAVVKREREMAAKHGSLMQTIGDVQAPFTGMSIAEREQMRPTVRAGGEAFARTFEPVQTKFENIRSNEALEKLQAFRDKQLSPTYARERVNSARDEMNKMLTRTGHEFFKARLNKLSDEQFFTFWEYGPYAGDTSMIYEITKSQQDQGTYTETDSQLIEDISMELNEAISWAEKLPKDGIDLGPQTNKRRAPGVRAKARNRAARRKGR